MSDPVVAVFKIGRTGWKRLDLILTAIQEGINKRAPVAGIGIAIDYNDNGAQISIPVSHAGDKEATVGNNSGGQSGSIANVFGAVNGVPKVFHLFQSSGPTDP